MKVRIERRHGMLYVDIAGKMYAPLSFKSFRPNPQNVSEFYQAGVRLFSVLSSGIICALGVPYSRFGESWVGESEYDFSAIDRQMDMFIENAPDGYFAPMFQIDTRPWFLKLHPDAPNSFTHLSWAAYHEQWKREAAEYLKAAIRHCEEKYGDRIYGYFLLGGMTTEWLAHPDKEASHPLKEAGYRAYCRDKNAKLPTLEELNAKGRVFLDAEEANVYQARRFHGDTVADLVLYFAAQAQSVIKHEKLLGLYYGYLLHLGGEFLYHAGHLGYEKVYLSPDIDMISSPSEYKFRKIDDPSGFMVTQKTLDAHNKLYFLEFDHITHVAPTMIDEPSPDESGNNCLKEIPGAASKCKDEQESLNLMYRDFTLCYANGAALWWFDMFDGWFRSPAMMQAIQKMIAIHDQLRDIPKQSVARIAVFAEGESMYHLRKSANIATVTLSDMRRTLAELGAPYDLYSIADLPLSRKYDLVILLNQYDLSEQQRQMLKDSTVLWLYAPDYVTGRLSQTVGMTVRETEHCPGGLCYNGTITENQVAAPYFVIEDGQPLAYYENGQVAVAKKGKSIYAAVPFIPSDLLRDIVKELGVPLYSTNPLVYTYVNAGAVGVYNATGQDAEVFVPDGRYIDMYTGESFQTQQGRLTLPLRGLCAYLLVEQSYLKE